MESIEGVVGGRDVVADLVSRCRCPVDRNRLGCGAGSRSRTVGGIGS